MIVRDVSSATIRAQLPEVIRFGDWVMRHREFVLTQVRTEEGVSGFAFALTRDGPVAAAIKSLVARQYVGRSVSDPVDLFHRALATNPGSLSSGIGMRALSLVDLAAWDAKAKSENASIEHVLGGTGRPLPATAIIGYPPTSMDADRVYAQVRALRDAGWRRFKIAIALPFERGRDRVLAARDAAGDDAWLGVDGAWMFRDVRTALEFLSSVEEARLAWFEDAFLPGDASIVAELRSRAGVAIAMGDEQGGSYYPAALLDRRAVDIVRLDLTCMGGVTRVKELIDRCEQAGVGFAPHMYAHIHSRVLSAIGKDAPIEWGVQWTGVDQYADSLSQPTIVDGLMTPLPEELGFGSLINADWVAEQEFDDPDGMLTSLITTTD